MNIGYFIPSYKRPDHKIKTYSFAPFAPLVVAESEARDYRVNWDNIVVCPDHVQGNLCRVRNWILDTMTGKYDAVVLLDDDIHHMRRFNGPKVKHLSELDFVEFCETAAQMADDCGAKLFGVNPVDDKGSYREYSPFSFTAYIGGPFQGHILNDNPIRYDENLPLKEDYDITLQHLEMFRKVLRFNFVHYICDQSVQKGGCASYRTMRAEREQFELLQKKWGSDIIQRDMQSVKSFDYNPILKSPIKGI